MPRYQTGARADVLRYMAECAIRDREALIDAYTPPSWQPVSKGAQRVINDCRAAIADFRLLAGRKPAKPQSKGAA